MHKIKDFYTAIDEMAPFSSAESWDNVGLIVGSMEDSVTGVLLALDVTSSVIDEAKTLGANLIITHHPLMFSAIKKLSSNDLVYKLAQSGIGLISAHTNLDIASGGVNDTLAKLLGLKNLRPLSISSVKPYYKIVVFVPTDSAEAVYTAMSLAGGGTIGNYSGCAFSAEGTGRFLPLTGANPVVGTVGELEIASETRLEMVVPPDGLGSIISAIKRSHPYEEPGYDIMETFGVTEEYPMGLIGEIKDPLTAKEFALLVKERLNATGVRFTDNNQSITTIALCSGSGGDLLPLAIAKGADAYVTGEIQHHFILEAMESNVSIIEAGHFSTEIIAMEPLKQYLDNKIKQATIYLSENSTDGIKVI